MLFIIAGCTNDRPAVSLEEALLASGELENVNESGTGAVHSESSESEEAVCYVYVCGSVVNPGVYVLEAGSRIVAAVEAAGGFLEDAATEAINLAEPVQDGMKIVVPDLTEYAAEQVLSERDSKGLVNLNTADAEALCTLNGIGASRAEAILAYRKEIGGFKSIEQLMEVAGIGESLFQQIKSSIYIE